MRKWHGIALFLCGAATALVVWQAKQISRIEGNASSAAIAGAAPSGTNEISAELLKLREEVKELPRLRNEARRLKDTQVELATAQGENRSLVQAKASGSAIRRESPAGFVSKDKLANVGYATPADSLQTFFWALREGDFKTMLASFSPGSEERQRIERMTPEQQAKLAEKLAGPRRSEDTDRLTDLGVRASESLSDTSMVLHVGSSLATNTVRMRFDLTPDGWKLRDTGF